MSDKKKANNGFMFPFQGMNIPAPQMPFVPLSGRAAWGWSARKEDRKKQRADFKSYMETFWEQMREIQKASMEAAKKQWNTFFGQYIGMQEAFAASLPDKMPSMPGMPDYFILIMSPKSFMEKLKEFQEMVNTYTLEQADTFFDLMMQGQEQISAMAVETAENAEAKVIEITEPIAEPKAEKKAEAKPVKKAEAKPVKKAEAKPVKKAEPKAEKKAEAKPAKKAEPKAEKKAEVKPAKKAEPKAEKKAEAKPVEKAEPKAEKKAEAKPAEKAEPKAEKKAEAKPAEKAEPKAEKKAEAKPAEKPEVKPVEKPEVKVEKTPEVIAEKKPEVKAEEKIEAKDEKKA